MFAKAKLRGAWGPSWRGHLVPPSDQLQRPIRGCEIGARLGYDLFDLKDQAQAVLNGLRRAAGRAAQRLERGDALAEARKFRRRVVSGRPRQTAIQTVAGGLQSALHAILPFPRRQTGCQRVVREHQVDDLAQLRRAARGGGGGVKIPPGTVVLAEGKGGLAGALEGRLAGGVQLQRASELLECPCAVPGLREKDRQSRDARLFRPGCWN